LDPSESGIADAAFPTAATLTEPVFAGAETGVAEDGIMDMTNPSPSPKNLYSIFSPKSSSKAPTLTPLGKTCDAATTKSHDPAGGFTPSSGKHPVNNSSLPSKDKPGTKTTTVSTTARTETDAAVADFIETPDVEAHTLADVTPTPTIDSGFKTPSASTPPGAKPSTSAPPKAIDPTSVPRTSSSTIDDSASIAPKTSGVDTSGYTGARGTEYVNVASTQPSKGPNNGKASKPTSVIERTPIGPAPVDSVLADAQATDALAAEALEATDGALTTVADAIEAGLESVTPSGVDSHVSKGYSTVRKPGFQTALKAPLAIHIQAPTATKCSTVTPSGSDSNTPSTVDSTVKGAGSASSVGGPRIPPTSTQSLGVPGASAITRIGTGSSAALGNTDTRANTSNKSDIESTSVSSKSPPTENYDATLHGPEDPHTSNQPIYVDPGFPFRLTPMSFALRVTNSP